MQPGAFAPKFIGEMNMKGRTILTTLSVVAMATIGLAQIRVSVDGQTVRFGNQQPIEQNDRVLVPLRGVFEEMGANVRWNPNNHAVTAERNGQRVRLRIGSREANVDGRVVTLDVPPTIMNGSTMVPLRFISESLGATVDWREYDQTVLINSGAGMGANDLNPPARRPAQTYGNRRRNQPTQVRRTEYVLERSTIIPAVLDERISSADARKGDRINSTVRTGDERGLGIPAGTRIEGYVADVHRYGNNHPGMIELRFDRMVLPGGREVAIDGSLIGLNSRNVTHRNGRLVATGSDVDNRGVYAGYGAGGGFVLGLLTRRPLEDAILGGLLGLGAGELERRGRPSEVNLRRGTEFGVRLNQSATIGRDSGG